MTRHEATFEIESRTDAHAVRMLTEQVLDTLREERRGLDQDRDTLDETVRDLRAIREAARDLSPGTLTITYEQRDEPFDG